MFEISHHETDFSLVEERVTNMERGNESTIVGLESEMLV